LNSVEFGKLWGSDIALTSASDILLGGIKNDVEEITVTPRELNHRHHVGE